MFKQTEILEVTMEENEMNDTTMQEKGEEGYWMIMYMN